MKNYDKMLLLKCEKLLKLKNSNIWQVPLKPDTQKM